MVKRTVTRHRKFIPDKSWESDTLLERLMRFLKKDHSGNPVPDERGCWLFLNTVTKYGYGRFSYKKMLMVAHRASWTAFRGPIPDGLWVLHECDVRHCINPQHLFLGDAQANVDDREKKRRGVYGERHHRHQKPEMSLGENNGNAEVTEEIVIEIRTKYATGMYSLMDLAQEYQRQKWHISKIVSGILWKHLPLIPMASDESPAVCENRGEVPFDEYAVEMFWERVEITDGCWLWTGSKNDKGYGDLKLRRRGRWKAHRMSWIIEKGYDPIGYSVRHTCDNPPCVRPNHLVLGTCLQNTHDMMQRGRASGGSPHSKINARQ